MPVDYSLYLVTDTTEAVLGKRDLLCIVEEALKGGVTVVQHRDKLGSTAEFVRTAKALHLVTSKYNVPLLINDRIDVALAVGCEGVHIGQDDMDIATARKLLGPTSIIGVTVSSVTEAHDAATQGANYLGIGTMFATSTKKDTKDIIGTAGTRAILLHLSTMNLPQRVATVAIGGINRTNVQRVMYQTKAASRSLDGVAVVSAIIAAQDAQDAASSLRRLITNPPAFAVSSSSSHEPRLTRVPELVSVIPAIIRRLGEANPVCHNMTNLVVQNFAANVALAVGGSPIMANDGHEAADLSKLGGSLVLNMGSTTPQAIEHFRLALAAYNAAGAPVLFDPVGGGATSLRRAAVRTLMAAGYFDVIKGNESEIATVWAAGGNGDAATDPREGQAQQQKGVDSGTSSSTHEAKARLVRDLAARERNVVVMTGAADYLSDGERVLCVRNGHPLLGMITGSGCTLGTTVAAFVAVEREDKLLAALAALLMYELAAEMASKRADVKGPGTFVPALVDCLSEIARLAERRELSLGGAKVEALELVDGAEG